MFIESAEQALLANFTKYITDKRQINIDYLASGSFETLEQAREFVGQIRAYSEMQAELERLYRTFLTT